MKSAWLIGAGFSYEFGLPLVAELTKQIRSVLTPETLRGVNSAARQGHGHPRQLIDEFLPVLQRADLHYEQIIGWLQTESLRRPREREHLLKLAEALQAFVSGLLVGYHTRNASLFRFVLPWFRGLEDHLPCDGPLWVFSLNHDICVEMVCAELGIDVSCGYGDPPERLLTSSGEERMLDRLSRETLASGALDFGSPGRRGVNLVKLHGSLDVFGYDDLRAYLRVRPATPTAAGWLAAIESAEADMHALHNGQPYKVINEICARDAAGEIQFLRKTPVAGTLKFDRQMTYNAPVEFIEFFERKLDDFDTLVVIGYGWGDAHINGPIEAWLARRSQAHLVVVNPSGLPAGMAAVASRCEPLKIDAAEYVSKHRWTSFSNADRLKRRVRLMVRHDSTRTSSLMSGANALQAEWLAMVPAVARSLHDGMSHEEIAAKVPSVESMLETLLAHMGQQK